MAETQQEFPRLNADQRKTAATQFERAGQVLNTKNYDYALQLLNLCCLADPANMHYRQTLRYAQRQKYKNNGRGHLLAFLYTIRIRARIVYALTNQLNLDVLKHCEEMFMYNPWDLWGHLTMATAFEQLGSVDLAIWAIEQVRAANSGNVTLNRQLAKLFEKRGNFSQAAVLWSLVNKAMPSDTESARKAQDLAAAETIARGKYEEAAAGSQPTPLVSSASPDGEEKASQTPRPAPVSRASRAEREIEQLREAIQASPKQAQPYLQLAALFRRAGKLDEAAKVLREGLGPTGQDFSISQEILDLEIEPFRRDLAIAQDQVRRNAGDANLREVIKKLSKEIDIREMEMYRRRVDRFASDKQARFELGLRLLRVGQYDEAIKELQTVRNDPKLQGKALYYAGLAFKARRNWRLAQKSFEDALSQLANDPDLKKDTLYQLATGLADAGDVAKALDLGSELAQLDFNYKNIGELLDAWQQKAGR